MFTVKQRVNNATTLFQVESIVIAMPGSDQWVDAMKLLNVSGAMGYDGDVDYILSRSPEFYDESMTDVAYEGHNIVVHRGNSSGGAPYAITIFDGEDIRETQYQFIYPGDEVYVMNSSGSTVETVRQIH
ncbi:Gp63 phage protein [Sodalis praecaptivus]|uniref:Gp63 phage protein n=1 Tax=Sodalis praecaptivus TaxID=1239307 RepID=W0HZG2_9GAMM|nr:hypothetical protein [Sodalis praecaptivus]AHF77907.1 Gp63 phage protein [Sodalis praecaptivus]